MKHLLLVVGVLLTQVAFAQRFDLQTYNPVHDIQEEIKEWYDRDIIGGYMMGYLWKTKGFKKPFLSLIVEADRYLLRVELSSTDGVYVTGLSQHPFANFEAADGNIISLRCDTLTPVVALASARTISNASPIIGSTWYSDSRGSTAGISAPRKKMMRYTENQIMRLESAIKRLRTIYKSAKKNEAIRDPVAYAFIILGDRRKK